MKIFKEETFFVNFPKTIFVFNFILLCIMTLCECIKKEIAIILQQKYNVYKIKNFVTF